MNTNGNNNQTRAKRRPDDLKYTSGHQVQKSANHNVSNTNGQNIRNNTVRQTGNTSNTRTAFHPENGNIVRINQAHGRQTVRNMSPVRNVGYLQSDEERKLILKERKQQIEIKKEEEWQRDIVRTRGGIDIVMLSIILVLLVLGTITVFSASYPYAIASSKYSNDYFFKHQALFLAIGGAAMIVMTLIPVKAYKKWAPIPAFVIAAGLLVAVLFIGSSEGEATRWIRIGGIGIQPSEIMKIALVFTLGWYVEKYEDKIKDTEFGWTSIRWNTLFPFGIVCLACLFIIIGKHLSGTVITAAIGFLLLLVAGSKLKWLILTALPVGLACIGGYLLLNPYALERVTTKFDENADVFNEKYQTIQSVLAIGNGGAFGVGLGKSVQKYSYLSAAHTDFIFSIWCEEWGFVGAVLLIVLYILFMWRGYLIAIRAEDKFSTLTAFGITTQVGLQAFLNMAVAADIIPNTGISLPFFSYGGSSLVVLMAEMGILLSISRHSYKKKAEIQREEMMKKAGMAV